MEVDWEVLEINIFSLIFFIKVVFFYFIERKVGYVVYISSVVGKIGKGINLYLYLFYLLVYFWLVNWVIGKIGKGNLD